MSNCSTLRRVVAAFVVAALVSVAPSSAAPNQRYLGGDGEKAAKNSMNFVSTKSSVFSEKNHVQREGRLARRADDDADSFAADFCVGKPDQTVCTAAGTCLSGKCSNEECFKVNVANGQACDGGQCSTGECKPATSCAGVIDLTPCEPGPRDPNECISSSLCVSGSCLVAPGPCPTDPPTIPADTTVAPAVTDPAPASTVSCVGVPALSKCEVNSCVWGVCSKNVCTPTAMLPDGTNCPGGFCFALGGGLGSAGCQPESQRLTLFPEATTTTTTIPTTSSTITTTAPPPTEKPKRAVNESEQKWAGPLLAVVIILVLIVVGFAYVIMYKPDLFARYNITCLDWLLNGGQGSGNGPMLVKPLAPLPPRAPRVPPKPPTDLALADSFVSAKLPFNVDKNRYRDVLPYEATRVKLKADAEVEGSDYINANFVCGIERDAPYIATQGPIESTVGDFWRMVWEQQVSTIAMLTRFVESNKEKVFRYFPGELNVEVQYGNYLVTLMAEVSEPEFVVRRLDLVEAGTGIKRVIRHAQYIAWPDHGVPEETASILTYRRVVRQCHEDAHGVMLVHCSAGVGRAGSFIAVDQALEAFNATGKVDIHSTVCTMRRCRPYVVQRASQYVYLHRAILEAVTTEPPIAAEGLDFTQVDFATRFFVPSQLPAFDLGCGGRNILHVGSISRCNSNWANAKDAMLCLTTDVLLVCDVTPNGFYRLAMMPLLRNKVAVEGSDPSSETASFTIEVEGDKPGKMSKLLCVAEDGAAKREWETKLNNRSGFLPTESLRGPRIVGFQTPTWHEALVLFGCADPNTEEGSQELQREWDGIPKILDADAALIPDQNTFPGLTDSTNAVTTFGGSGAQNTNPLFGAQIEGVGGSGAGWMDHEIQPADPSSPAPGSPAINMSQFPGFPGSPASPAGPAAAGPAGAMQNVGGQNVAPQFVPAGPGGMFSPTPGFNSATPMGMTPMGMTPMGGAPPMGMTPGGMTPMGMPLTRAMFDAGGQPMTPGALQAHRYQQQQMAAAMSGMFPGFGTGAPKEFQPVMPLFTPRAPNMAKEGGAYNPPLMTPADSMGGANLPDRINSLASLSPMASPQPGHASGISLGVVEDSSTDVMNVLGSQYSETNTDAGLLSPPMSPMGGPPGQMLPDSRRFSTTDLSGAFNPSAHNMPKLPSFRGRGGTFKSLGSITETDTRRMSIMSELAEPLELAGPLDLSVHDVFPQSPRGPNFPAPAPPSSRAMVGLGAVAGQVSEGALMRSDIMMMAPELTAPPKAYDPRSAMMAQMVSPAIFNSPVNSKSDMPNGIERWAAPELYDFDDGTQARTRPGTPEDYGVEKGEIDVSVAKGVPDSKPVTILNSKGGGSLQDRWKKAARRASIVAQISAMINTPIKNDAPFGLVGKAAKRMNVPDKVADAFKLQEDDRKLHELPTMASFRVKHTKTMHRNSNDAGEVSEGGGVAAANAFASVKISRAGRGGNGGGGGGGGGEPAANAFASAAFSRAAKSAPAPAAVEAAPEPAGDPNQCSYLGSCECPDCR